MRRNPSNYSFSRLLGDRRLVDKLSQLITEKLILNIYNDKTPKRVNLCKTADYERSLVNYADPTQLIE